MLMRNNPLLQLAWLTLEDGESVGILAKAGSVEAIFNAIDKFFNQTVRLTSYNIDAVTDAY